MRRRRAGAVAGAALALVLSGCAGGAIPSTVPETALATPVAAPVTRAANDLQGATVHLIVGQTLNITTGDLAVDSYRAEIEDPQVAEFVPGRVDGATFDPGVRALAEGTTEVEMTNAQGGIEPLRFTVEVELR
ncbi:hypothetical protein ACIQLJ_07620 [Microbacterium sp. NPDC091313]